MADLSVIVNNYLRALGMRPDGPDTGFRSTPFGWTRVKPLPAPSGPPPDMSGLNQLFKNPMFGPPPTQPQPADSSAVKDKLKTARVTP